jgi:hypothetical protein
MRPLHPPHECAENKAMKTSFEIPIKSGEALWSFYFENRKSGRRNAV